ncbi:zinc finger cdgsh-type domain protein [Stylonychia lemnae]|uniref:Zinc finger cdgsh-type domain protein n=1 Tax=Stylonychia lemnae TaxID=5949 RepID=A0A078AJJ8_STYLE|nr:zinc finger cdgsh-type domain protein [Stylonychia lemnae]|eukprot:CDW81647.1 zinc finger cdgsh-type domain protein [Stylonychia lemnae]
MITQQQRQLSIFSSLFGKKKPEEKQPEPRFEKVPEKKEEVIQAKVEEPEKEPTRYHQATADKKKKQKQADAADTDRDIKQQIKSLDRSQEDNLYGKFKRQRKTVQERDQNLHLYLHPDLQNNSRVSIAKFESRAFKRGLDEGEAPFPVSPRIGPYEVEKPIFGTKNYYWCSCGMSRSQPFCDSSHFGTEFKPLKFSLDEKSKKIHMCGCKLSTQKPFCDGDTCKKLLTGEKFEAAERLLENDIQTSQKEFAEADYQVGDSGKNKEQ